MFYTSLKESQNIKADSLFPVGRIAGRILCAEALFCLINAAEIITLDGVQKP